MIIFNKITNFCFYSPDSPQLELHRALSVEDVLVSRMVRPVSRVTQAFPDGTLLLELVKPPNGPFGFVISRGKGRPDTGKFYLSCNLLHLEFGSAVAGLN